MFNYDFYEAENKPKNITLFTLIEEPEKNIKLNQYEIQSPLYLFEPNLNKKGEMIFISNQFKLNGENNNLKLAIQKLSNTEFITELKIFQDEKNLYIVDKNGYIAISKTEKIIINEVNFELKNKIQFFKKVLPIYNKAANEIKNFIILDEAQNIKIEVNEKKIKKEENNDKNEIKLEEKDDIGLDISNIDLKKFKINEIENLSNLLCTGDIEMLLPKEENNSIKGITNLSENYYSKIYFDINKANTTTQKIKFKNSQFILSTDLDIAFNLKSENALNITQEINSINITDKSLTKIDYNELVQKPLTKDELFNLKNLIPLNIYDFKGAQSQYAINVSNVLTGAHRFVSNYPKPEFIFSHLNNEIMIIDNIIISSDIEPKSIDSPFGEGLIFLMNSLDNIEKAKEIFANYTLLEFNKFIEQKKSSNEDLYEFEPVCYIKMDKNEIVKSSVLKNRKCRYIYFLPTNSRDGNLQNFEKNMMSFLFFGVQGKVGINNLERISEDKSNYIFAKYGKKAFVDNINIEIYGYNENNTEEKILIGKKDKFQLNLKTF